MMARLLRAAAFAVSALAAGAAMAHKASDSYLIVMASGDRVDLQWDIALRDLDFAVGLDGDGDGQLTWGEIEAHAHAIDAYALSRLALASEGRACALRVLPHQVEHHVDGAYIVLRMGGPCPGAGTALDIDYRLLFDVDPQHRGLLRLEANGRTSTAIFSPDRPHQQISNPGFVRQFLDYLKMGVWHIWIGFDHVLFLLSLLLPAVLTFGGRQWRPARGLRVALLDVVKIVSAFTLAHSVTLTLASLGVVALPSRLVESGIAASVIVAALNNVYPMLPVRRWIAAFVFGLIHGFGFASVLADLGLPHQALALALVGFNIGVECGQLALIALFLPLAYRWRRTRIYRRLVMGAGSLSIAAVATVWFTERAFDLRIFAL